MTIPILFEDADIIAANKPDGIATIPGSEQGKDTLLGLISAQYPQKIFVVHRLDKDVSGVILFAKNAAAHKSLNEQFFNRTIHKTYMALVYGTLDKQQGSISKPIHKFGSGRMGIDEIRGKPSCTDYELVEALPDYSLVKAFPKTGRRHQIRVHFYSIGHSIAGDTQYGDKSAMKPFPRMMLHAHSITFKLQNGEEKSVDCPLPESFTSVIDGLRESPKQIMQ